MNKWDELAKIAGAVFERDVAQLSAMTAAESAAAGKRAKLEALNRQAMESARTNPAYQSHTGDFAWQSWVSHSAREIGIEQARLRALREVQLPKLRFSFGRKAVLESIAREASEQNTRCR